jgi:hypothetical protein
MTDYNGNEWPQEWVKTYDNMTRLIESTYGDELRETYLNQRHQFYVLCVKTLAEG